MKATRKLRELLSTLEFRREGFTWRELKGTHTHIKLTDAEPSITETSFPRQTLAHLLKILIEEGLVEKIPEPRLKGKKGRPSYRYRIAPDVQNIAVFPSGCRKRRYKTLFFQKGESLIQARTTYFNQKKGLPSTS